MQTNGLRVLLNHFEDKPTFIFKLSDSIDDIVVSNGCQTFRIDEMRDVFDEYDVSPEQEKLVKDAIDSLKNDNPLSLDELFNICRTFNFFCTFDIISTLPNPYDTLNLYQRVVGNGIGIGIVKLRYSHVAFITERILKVGEGGLDRSNIEHLNQFIDNLILVGDNRDMCILECFCMLFNNIYGDEAVDYVKTRLKMFIDSIPFPVPTLRDFIENNLSGNFLIGSMLLDYKEHYAFHNTISYLKYNLSECKLNTLPEELSEIIRSHKSE